MNEFWTDSRFGPKIWVIVPQFGKMDDKERTSWRNELQDELDSLFITYSLPSSPTWLFPTVELGIQHIKFLLPDVVTKGIGVRLAAASILYSIDRDLGPVGRRHNWIVMVDGTGAYIKQLHQVVLALQNSPAVLGNRIGAYKGMSEERVMVEQFENQLLQMKYGRALADCQAGIWGMRLDVLESVSLTASGYGLEFDLAACLLESKIPFDFAEVTVNPKRSPSTFDPVESINKLRFIGQRLDIAEDRFRELLREYDQPLPADYMDRINQILDGRAPNEQVLFCRRVVNSE